MTNFPVLPLTPEWQIVTYVGAEPRDGKFGAYWEVKVQKDGKPFHFRCSNHAYRDNFHADETMVDLRHGDIIQVRKGTDQFSSIEWKR